MPDIEWWKAAIEIPLLACGIYAILRFLRGSRGAAILRGGIIALGGGTVLLLFVAKRLQLSVIESVVQQLSTLAAIALIIIFQPDLRRALVRLGERSFFHVMARGRASVIDEIVSAAVKMARNDVGALIAIEREVGLKSYVEGGAKVDSVVTAELLETIFFPNSPLSDGAVVIREDRVVAAGCLFPLTETPGLSQELGTRHRSGIGITEESDTICVIVSEERGEISLAVRGHIQRNLNANSLSKLLRELHAEVPDLDESGEQPVEVRS